MADDAGHDLKQMKLQFVETPMVSQFDSIADSHSQRESEPITKFFCSINTAVFKRCNGVI